MCDQCPVWSTCVLGIMVARSPYNGSMLRLTNTINLAVTTTLLQDNIDHQCCTSQEREGFSKTDSTQYCNSRNTKKRDGAKLLAAPPMHKIQPNGSIKDYSKYPDMNKEHKLKAIKTEHPEG